MTIKSLDEAKARATDFVGINKTATRTTVASVPFSLFDIAGNPGAGALAVGNTTTGIVPTNALAGYPPIKPFPPGKTGELHAVDFNCSVSARLTVYDTVFSAGAFAFNANTTLATQPSFASRCQVAASWVANTAFELGDYIVNGANAYQCIASGVSAGSGGPTGTGASIVDGTVTWAYWKPGVDYTNNEIWLEAVTPFTGNLSCAATYDNQDGTTGRSTGVVATGAALIVGRYHRMPFQSASTDSGVSKINNITGTVATAGTYNVHVLRRLWSGRVRVGNDGDIHGPDVTGCPVVFADSALRYMITADGTSSGLSEVIMQIKAG